MEQIQDPFDASRSHAWPQVVEFIENTPRSGWLLDLAAGNGRHAVEAARRGHAVVAVDVAHGLMIRLRDRLQQAAGTGVKTGCVEADVLSLPIARSSVQCAVFAAGLHCIRGRGDRIASLVELHRVLVPQAPVIVTVWWRDPKRFRGPLARTEAALQPSGARQAVHWNEDGGHEGGDEVPALEPGDVSLPWGHGVDVPVDRFFHLYEEEELRQDLRSGGFVDVDLKRVRYGSTWNLIATMERSGGH